MKDSQHMKADAGKRNPLILEKDFVKSLSVVQSVLEYGAEKYERSGWKNVPEGQERYDAAARRHRQQRDLGQSHDDESGLLHIAHEITSNLMLLELYMNKNEGYIYTKYNKPPTSHKKE